MNNTTRTSQATINNHNSNFNAEPQRWSGSSISEEEDIGMCKGRRKSNVDNTNKKLKGKSSEEEEIKIPNCSRKIHVGTVNEDMKESRSEEDDIRIRKYRRRIRVVNMKKEGKGWTYSLKKQESPSKITKNTEEIRLEKMRKKLK